jgi:hypothetical protein
MNAKEGGNLLTTVAFGIPASVTMAILLGAFIIQGVVPGPAMLTTHLDLTMSFVWINIISHIISVGLCFLFLNQMVKITEIRSTLLLPPILMLALLGGFADKNTNFDMVASVVAGFVGMAMVRLDWPRPPLILGLVLGRIVETNLFISYARYDFTFVGRPLLVAIIVVGLATMLVPYARKRLFNRLGMRGEVAEEVAEADPQRAATSAHGGEVNAIENPRGDFLFGLVVLGMLGWMVWEARAWPLTPQLFPLTIGIPAVALALLQVGFATRRLFGWSRQRAAEPRPAMEPLAAGEGVLSAALARQRTIEMAFWILAFTLGVLVLGFRVGALVLPLAFFRLAGRERWRVAVPIAFGTYLCFTLLFAKGLHIPFPNGVLADTLGLESPDSYVLRPLLGALDQAPRIFASSSLLDGDNLSMPWRMVASSSGLR